MRSLVTGTGYIGKLRLTADSYQLQIKNERIQGVINSHIDAVYHLRLPGRVIDPIPLW